jgi:hypothetical protein
MVHKNYPKLKPPMENIPSEGISSRDPLANPEEQPMNEHRDPEDLSLRNLGETKSEPGPEGSSHESTFPLKIRTGEIDSDYESQISNEKEKEMPLTGKKEKKKKKDRLEPNPHATIVCKSKHFNQKTASNFESLDPEPTKKKVRKTQTQNSRNSHPSKKVRVKRQIDEEDDTIKPPLPQKIITAPVDFEYQFHDIQENNP